MIWLEGWSRCLSVTHFLKTGIQVDPMLDLHWVADGDLEKGTGVAAKINAVTDAARRLI